MQKKVDTAIPHIQIYMAEGRTIDQKYEMTEAITTEVSHITKSAPGAVHIQSFDMKREYGGCQRTES